MTSRVGRGASQSGDDVVYNLHRSAQNIGLPGTHHRPASLMQRARLLTVTFDVPPNLRDPVSRGVASGELHEPVLQIASMPKVAVAEDHETMPREHDVRASGNSGTCRL